MSVATGVGTTGLLLSLESTIASAGPASPVGAGAAGLVVAIALLPATARYPRGTLRRAKRVTLGAGLGLGVVGFAGYAGADVLPGPSALVATGATLTAVLPIAYDLGWQAVADPRTLVVGDDPAAVRRAATAIDPQPVGYCAPPSLRAGRGSAAESVGSGRSTGSDGPPGPQRSPDHLRSGGSHRSWRTSGIGGTVRDRPEPTPMRDGGTAGGSGGTDSESGRAGEPRPNAGTRRTTDGGDLRQPSSRPGASGSASRTAHPDADRSADSPRESGQPAPERLGGLSDLDRVVRDRGVDAVVLRFASADRDDFFGALRTCHRAGVDAFVPRSRAEATLLADEHRSLAEVERDPSVGESIDREPATDGTIDRESATDGTIDRESATDGTIDREPADRDSQGGDSPERDRAGHHVDADRSTLVPVALEVLPWHGRLAKRGFDLAFATVGIVACSPLMTAIAVAIRLDSPGPVLYGQWRTGRLGEPFQLLKFRSMVSDAEAASGPRLSDEDAGGVDPRVTRVGRVLRATHLDELPQLFSILAGEMSVVGPRPERPALDAEIAADGLAWRQRWFLRPGLTGLAQINDVTGFQPREKLAYDLEYAARQSLAFDVRIVATQLGQVARDVFELLERRLR